MTEEIEKTVTIPKSHYDYLQDRSDKLEYLEAGGVDNWEWYDASLEKYWEKQNDG